jgi:hypothetical protein
MKNLPDYSPLIRESGFWLQLAAYFSFVALCVFLFFITSRISRGHDIIGRFCLLVLVVGLFLMGFSPERITSFRVLVYTSLDVWIGYVVIYFKRFPIPIEHLKASRDPKIPSEPIYEPKWALTKYLYAEPQTTPFWKYSWFRPVTYLTVGLFIVCFGFSRAVNMYLHGWMAGTNTVVKAEKKTEQLITTAMQSATTAASAEVKRATAPLADAQAVFLSKYDSNALISTKRYQALARQAEAAKREAARANAEARRFRQSPVINVAPLQPKPATGTISPEKVQPLPGKYDRRGRRISDASQGVDSTLYAKWSEPEGY